MDRWYALSLGDALTAQPTLAAIRDAFSADVAGEPAPDCAVFTRLVSGDLHCEVTAWFAPGAAELAGRFGAVACPPPGRRGLELLAGEPRCWAALFD